MSINNLFCKMLISGAFISFFLQGCSVYKNKFDCNPVTGAHCKSVEEIHSMLENGQMWKFNGKEENCKGKKCKGLTEVDRIASRDGIIKVWIPERYRMEEFRDGQYWFLPSQRI